MEFNMVFFACRTKFRQAHGEIATMAIQYFFIEVIYEWNIAILAFDYKTAAHTAAGC